MSYILHQIHDMPEQKYGQFILGVFPTVNNAYDAMKPILDLYNHHCDVDNFVEKLKSLDMDLTQVERIPSQLANVFVNNTYISSLNERSRSLRTNKKRKNIFIRKSKKNNKIVRSLYKRYDLSVFLDYTKILLDEAYYELTNKLEKKIKVE